MPRQVNNSRYDRVTRQLFWCDYAISLWENHHNTIAITPDEVQGKLRWIHQWFPQLRRSVYTLQVRFEMLRWAGVIDADNKLSQNTDRR